MIQMIDIRRVEIGPKSLTARVRIAMGSPLMTSEDLEGTTRVYRLLPHIIDHVCLGDSGETFRDVMGDTEIAHLLEHVTVELLAQTDIAGDVTCGRTWEVPDERRTYDVEFPCPDDVLVAGALSSAAWILQWAYSGGGDPAPDIAATVRGLVGLVQSLPEPEPVPSSIREYVVRGEEAEKLLRGDVEDDEPEEDAVADDAEAEDADEGEPEAEAFAEPAADEAEEVLDEAAEVVEAEVSEPLDEGLPWDEVPEEPVDDSGLSDYLPGGWGGLSDPEYFD